LVQSYRQIFRNTLPTSHACKLPPYKIILHDRIPFKIRPYRHSTSQQQQARQQVDSLLQAGIIQEDESPYSSPVVMVSKKDNTTRFCIDFRVLNSKTIPDAAPIPRTEVYLQRLGGNKVFSVMDMTSGYHQLSLDESSRAMTSFSIDDSGKSYCWLRMPFGLRNAPVAFLRRVADVLRLPYVLVYIDDIIVFSKTWDLHIEHLRTVFNIFVEYQILIKPKKCTFGSTQVEFLVVNEIGVMKKKKKTQLLREIPNPQTTKELKSLLGLLSYYRRFVPQFASRTRNMYKAVVDTDLKWTGEMTLEKEDVYSAVASAFLSHPNFNWQFVVFTDASDVALGGAIHQINPLDNKIQPLAFHGV